MARDVRKSVTLQHIPLIFAPTAYIVSCVCLLFAVINNRGMALRGENQRSVGTIVKLTFVI